MILIPAPPVSVATFSSFDYVTIDPQRRRVYAAHTGSKRLTIVDADSGKVLGQIDVGPMHGVAVDPKSGMVFTGNGTDQSVSEVNPATMNVVKSVDVPGPVDAIAYDPALHRVYADEDSGTHVFVIDTNAMKMIGSVTLPGHDEEYLAIDPRTHAVYQNVPDRTAFVVIDAKTLRVTKIASTPGIKSNHPLQYDAKNERVIVGGKNGVIGSFTTGGRLVARGSYQKDVDQCSLDESAALLACAGAGIVSVLSVSRDGPPHVVARIDVHHEAHTVAIDPITKNLWIVFPGPSGDQVQRLHLVR